MSRELGGETQPCPKCTSVWKASYEREKSKRVDLDQKLSDARAALRGALTVLEDHDSCGGRRLTGYVFPECGREFPVSIDAIKAALASTPAPVAAQPTDSITVSPEQYQAIEDAIRKPAAPTQSLVDLFRDAGAITKRGGAK